MDQNKSTRLLREFVSQAMREYFEKIDGYPIDKVYNLVIGEVEKPLIEETIKYCKGPSSCNFALKIQGSGKTLPKMQSSALK